MYLSKNYSSIHKKWVGDVLIEKIKEREKKKSIDRDGEFKHFLMNFILHFSFEHTFYAI
jgi:hypothetical protein